MKLPVPAPWMRLPVPLRRRGFRLAHALLRIYWFFRRPAMHGVKCVLTNGDSVLLVRHTYGDREWELPGGGVKRGEQPLSAARREMLEELNVSIADFTELGELWANVHHRRDTMHCFHAELPGPSITIDRAELAVAGWFPLGELPLDLGRYVRAIVSRAEELRTR